jgi:ATP-dependent Clp protease ATP-binding subunit ClpA
LEFALREALQFGHDHIGTEHILLGLIREGQGVAAEILRRLGADPKRVRRTVIQQLSGYPAHRYGELPSPSPFEEREKIVLSLLIHQGMTPSKIADVLGVSKGRVGEILEGVIEKLKNVLTDRP